MAFTIPTHLKFKPPNFLNPHLHKYCSSSQHHYRPHGVSNPLLCYFKLSVLARASSDGGQSETFASQIQSSLPDVKEFTASSSDADADADADVALLIRKLGTDNDPEDRELAVDTLWRYSLDGKHIVDNIMKHHGTVNLVLNLLKSGSDYGREAAAGLLRAISEINVYRELVAESGAVEEINSLLMSPSLPPDVKVQAVCTLCNLAVDDEKLSARITGSEVLPLLLRYMDDEDRRVKEAALGALANLTLNRSNHKIMVEAGVIPKLAKHVTVDLKDYKYSINSPAQSKVMTAEFKAISNLATNALLELAKDEYYRILLMEEGLVRVPLVGAEAYKSYKSPSYSWLTLPDGAEIKRESTSPSSFGGSQLLVGLNKDIELDEATVNALTGQSNQQFLVRVGAIETNTGSQRFTILPWVDGVARLVLILGLADESAIARAAESIADASVTEHMRTSFKEAGAIKHLVKLISHPNDTIRLAAIRALDRLSTSNIVCKKIEAEGVLPPLVNLLKQTNSDISSNSTSMILNILTRILDPNKELKSANGREISSSELSSMHAITGEDIVDLSFLYCLVEILKTSIPDLQRKAVAVLEYIMVINPSVEKLIQVKIESGLEAVFQHKCLIETEHDTEDENPAKHILELEEGGLAVSAASRLLTKLLDYEQFQSNIDSHHFTKLLRPILKSRIPLQNKDWVAACLVKLSSQSDHSSDSENPVNTEVTLYETIPRLVQQIQTSYSPQVQESAVIELNRIISEQEVDSTRAIASEGGIFPLVKLLEDGSDRAMEASLAVLYNLSMDTENHAAIIAAGAVPLLRKLVLAQRSQWIVALHLLRILPT